MTQEPYVHIQFLNSGTPDGNTRLVHYIVKTRTRCGTSHKPTSTVGTSTQNNLGSEMLLTVCCVRLSQLPVVASGRLSASRIQPHHGIEASDIRTLIGL